MNARFILMLPQSQQGLPCRWSAGQYDRDGTHSNWSYDPVRRTTPPPPCYSPPPAYEAVCYGQRHSSETTASRSPPPARSFPAASFCHCPLRAPAICWTTENSGSSRTSDGGLSNQEEEAVRVLPPVLENQPPAASADQQDDRQQGEQSPPSYIAWSIFSLVFCFWPFGLAALIFAIRVNSAPSRQQASRFSKFAKTFNVAAMVVGPTLMLTSVLLWSLVTADVPLAGRVVALSSAAVRPSSRVGARAVRSSLARQSDRFASAADQASRDVRRTKKTNGATPPAFRVGKLST